MGRNGDNTSVYLTFDFIEKIEAYAKKNGFVNVKGKPNISKALVYSSNKFIDAENNEDLSVNISKNNNKESNKNNSKSIIERYDRG